MGYHLRKGGSGVTRREYLPPHVLPFLPSLSLYLLRSHPQSLLLCVCLCTCVCPNSPIVQAQKMTVPPKGGWEIAFPGLRLSNFQGKPCRRDWSLGLEGLSPPLPLDAASHVSRAIPPFLWVSCGQGCRQWVALAWAPPQTGTCWDASCLGCRCFFSPPSHLQVYSQFQNTTSCRAPSE